MWPEARPIPEWARGAADAPPRDMLTGSQPFVVRGLVAQWPVVKAALQSASAAMAYLRGFCRPGAPPVVATVGPPDIEGRFFYAEGLKGFNFRQEEVPLPVALDTLLKYLDDPSPPAIYVASTTIDTWLPGFNAQNQLALEVRDPLTSIWIGNRTRVPAHQDVPDNLACVVAGRRRVTLFPPQQLSNLYVGPLDHTPAGQPISLVDFAHPDEGRFPRFAEARRHALTADLGPGDAVFIPSMWWHHMEALEPFNVLVNYWWRQAPAWMDTPMNALMLALMTVRDLPPHERAAWEDVFRHYVFHWDGESPSHIPPDARGALAPFDENRARSLRSRLLQRLNR